MGISISLQITVEVCVSLYIYQGDLLCLGFKIMQTLVGDVAFSSEEKLHNFRASAL